jgi:hypothetical protein
LRALATGLGIPSPGKLLSRPFPFIDLRPWPFWVRTQADKGRVANPKCRICSEALAIRFQLLIMPPLAIVPPSSQFAFPLGLDVLI